MGKRNSQNPRKILVKLRNYDDKEFLLRLNSQNISNFESNIPDKPEKVHINYCKRSLNVNKFSSTTAVMSELARYPIIHNAYALSIKYWLRLESGTKNLILNEAYRIAVMEKHNWIQSIQYLLSRNGFKNVWNNSNSVCYENFHKVFRNRLNVQYEQNTLAKIRDSDRLTVLASLKSDFNFSTYINKIKSPDVRKIYTRLRIDLNKLNVCQFRYGKVPSAICTECNAQNETVIHLLFYCKRYQGLRNTFIETLSKENSNFTNLSDERKLKYVLNLDCPRSMEGLCCNYVKNVYNARDSIV